MNKRKKCIMALAACLAGLSLLCGCQAKKPRTPLPTTGTALPSRSPSRAPTASPAKPLPTNPAGKTASQDTAGAYTALPEEAGVKDRAE